MIYIAENQSHRRRLDLETLNIVWIEGTPFYRPTDSPASWIYEFEALLEPAYSDNADIILIGDFNINFLKPIAQTWQSVMEIFHLEQLVKTATRITEKQLR